jgi:hypothetical protein
MIDLTMPIQQCATRYPTYQCAAHVVKILNNDDETLETGWCYTVVNHLDGWAVGVIDDTGQFLGKM